MVIIQSFQYGGVIRLKPSDESGSRDVKAYRDGNGRNMQIDELRHMAIRLLHVRSFPTIPGSKESAHNWARTTLQYCAANAWSVAFSWDLGNYGSQTLTFSFPTLARTAALTRYRSTPLMCDIHRDRLGTVLCD